MQINIGVLGLGTVGCGTVEVLRRNEALINRRAGCELHIKRIVTKHPGKVRPINVDAKILSANVDDILNDPEIDIVAELIGGIEPAHEYVMRAIAAKKSVVTANKELIAKFGPSIRRAAESAGVDFLFEGSVGGGIPLIKPLRESLCGNRVRELIGILNGTTNFILTRMAREREEFGDVLAEAQRLGYAEADPSADVDGYDTTYKLAIVASIAFNTDISVTEIFREGIRGVGARDIEYARELGYVIKLLAVARQHEDGALELRVHPSLLPSEHPLANVNDVFNAVFINGDAVGDLMFYGRGAGGEPTGSAVISDLVEAARNRCLRISGRAPHEAAATLHTKTFADVQTRFCVRMQVSDKPGMMAKIATVFGNNGVSIESIVQKRSDGGTAEIFWLTHRTSQQAMTDSLDEFSRLEDAVREVSSVLRVEGD